MPDPNPQVVADTIWVLFAGALVFFMNAGFGLLETGLCRSKNAVNVLSKNFVVAAMAGLAFFSVGFALMFGDGTGLVGLSGFFLEGADNSPLTGEAYAGVFGSLAWTGVPLQAKFFFQVCFVMTAASIVSGAVAERIRFASFVVFSLLLAAVVYPVTGHWIWGGGWLGFNAGSTMAADPSAIAHVATTTMLASMAGISGALLVHWSMHRVFDLTFMINGCLAGLVGITAGCAFVTPTSAIIIGGLSGAIVVPAVALFDRLRIDDPVGAISVHLVGGIWGTLAVGLFADARLSADVGNGLFLGGGLGLLGTQALGVVAVGLFVSTASAALWMGVRAVVGLRVTAQEEILGLDITEMGQSAYGVDPFGEAHAVAMAERAAPAGSPGAASLGAVPGLAR